MRSVGSRRILERVSKLMRRIQKGEGRRIPEKKESQDRAMYLRRWEARQVHLQMGLPI